MENPINKIRQSSIVFEKTGILFENIETSFKYPRVFFAGIWYMFSTY